MLLSVLCVLTSRAEWKTWGMCSRLTITAITKNTKLCSCSFSHISTIKTFTLFQSQFDGKSQILLYLNERGIMSFEDTTAECFLFQRAGEVKGRASSSFFCGTVESLIRAGGAGVVFSLTTLLDICHQGSPFKCQRQVIHSASREDVQRKPRSSHS